MHLHTHVPLTACPHPAASIVTPEETYIHTKQVSPASHHTHPKPTVLHPLPSLQHTKPSATYQALCSIPEPAAVCKQAAATTPGSRKRVHCCCQHGWSVAANTQPRSICTASKVQHVFPASMNSLGQIIPQQQRNSHHARAAHAASSRPQQILRALAEAACCLRSSAAHLLHDLCRRHQHDRRQTPHRWRRAHSSLGSAPRHYWLDILCKTCIAVAGCLLIAAQQSQHICDGVARRCCGCCRRSCWRCCWRCCCTAVIIPAKHAHVCSAGLASSTVAARKASPAPSAGDVAAGAVAQRQWDSPFAMTHLAGQQGSVEEACAA